MPLPTDPSSTKPPTSSDHRYQLLRRVHTLEQGASNSTPGTQPKFCPPPVLHPNADPGLAAAVQLTTVLGPICQGLHTVHAV
eukprot:3070038-Amphidinium_carterae.1